MKITCEPFGDQIGVDNNITKAFKEKSFKLRVNLLDEENKWQTSFILSTHEANQLINEITNAHEAVASINGKIT